MEELKIVRKSKKDNLYIYNYNRPYRGKTTKIILLKKKVLEHLDEDEDYWEFLISKIVKIAATSWKELVILLKKYKFDNCKKVKIYSELAKASLKMSLYKNDRLFIFYDTTISLAVDLTKIRAENPKLYKKLENRYCYKHNYGHPDIDIYADHYNATQWFLWFGRNYPQYIIEPTAFRPLHEPSIYWNGPAQNYETMREPSIDYDLDELCW